MFVSKFCCLACLRRTTVTRHVMFSEAKDVEFKWTANAEVIYAHKEGLIIEQIGGTMVGSGYSEATIIYEMKTAPPVPQPTDVPVPQPSGWL